MTALPLSTFSPEAQAACRALEQRWSAERLPGRRYLTRRQARAALRDIGQAVALVALYLPAHDRAIDQVLRAIGRAAGQGGAR